MTRSYWRSVFWWIDITQQQKHLHSFYYSKQTKEPIKICFRQCFTSKNSSNLCVSLCTAGVFRYIYLYFVYINLYVLVSFTNIYYIVEWVTWLWVMRYLLVCASQFRIRRRNIIMAWDKLSLYIPCSQFALHVVVIIIYMYK